MKKLLLNGKWLMTGGNYRCEGTVPGSVYSFLLENSLIDDPYYRMNELELTDILNDDVTFSRHFEFTPDGSPVHLLCEGLDTLAVITVNGKHISDTDNMHRTYEFDITGELVEGDNEISITIRSTNRYIKEWNASDPVPAASDALAGVAHIRKAGCMLGWDWGPRLPDAGIWRDISLLILDSDRITELHVTQRHENGKVFITPEVKTEKGTADVKVTLTCPDGSTASLNANVENEIENPLLWMPRGYGEQNLYTVTVSLTENGVECDRIEKRIRLRTMELIREDDEYGMSFFHRVNGLDIFAMGADYIPEDNILSRLSEKRTRELLNACVECNFNAVRVWGGGFYPNDYFFDICDELGLLVFFDLMFACQAIPTRSEYMATVEAEIRDNLKRIRNHPCLAVISGNNEVEEAFVAWGWQTTVKNFEELKNTYLHLFEKLAPAIIDELCPYIPYVPSSPCARGSFVDTRDDNKGDSHYWQVWHGNLPFSEYRNQYFRYLSEFGFESFPSEKTVNSFTLPEDRNIFSRVMEMHQRCKGANGKILTYLSSTFLYPTDFGTLLYASQLLQAEAIKYGVEHLRRNRGRCMGALYWQLNDIWPVASWASIDYYGRYKALQYVAKRFYSPIMISCAEIGETTTRPYVIMERGYYDYETKAVLDVANETANEVRGTVCWSLRSSDSAVLCEGKEDITVPAYGNTSLKELDFKKTDVENNYLYFSFVIDGETVSEGSVLFTAPKHFNFRDPNLRCEIYGDEITVYADAYAKYVEIDSPDSDFVLSDNYFDMNAGKKTVKIIRGTPKTIKVRSVYDIR